MANYVSTVRTNYFRVKNEKKFFDFVSHLRGECEDVRVMTGSETDKEKHFAFGCYGGIDGYFVDEDDDDIEKAYERFLRGLQENVAVDDAVIILNVGNEGLRYVIGCATIVTSKAVEYLNITNYAKQIAAKMLDIPEWNTTCEY